MGTCCSRDLRPGGWVEISNMEEDIEDEEDDVHYGNDGARMRLQGSSRFTSMCTRQGRKGINQDAMTVWEDFAGKKGLLFCGVFDGHGPFGHKVARQTRDILPSKLSTAFKLSQLNGYKFSDVDTHTSDEYDDDDDGGGSNYVDAESNHENDIQGNSFLSSWKTSFLEAFKQMDEELGQDFATDCFCSGATAVTLLRQGDHLIIANLGDSRAVLASRGSKNQLVPVQLTVDMKPNLPGEAGRIKNCKGRILAMDGEPGVYRIWMPEEDCPGLAMTRAFGDFCLKDYGLISIPDVTYRKLTEQDEFVVLATDGVWDVLTNNEVIKIIASAKKQSMAARLLVNRAFQAWKCKCPSSRVDDCAVICLFLKQLPPLTRSKSEMPQGSENAIEPSVLHGSSGTRRMNGAYEAVQAGKITEESKDNSEVRKANSRMKLPRFANRVMSWQRSVKGIQSIGAPS